MIWWVLVRRGKWLKPWSTCNNHAHKVSQKSVWPIKDSRGAVKSEKEGRGRGGAVYCHHSLCGPPGT